ncbi:glutathione S-transferase A-like [Branchiostoma floridae]|uniref:Glutathione S-transferase A-like n=1 Tax=Branchiostoma floridae TaxID=7739 RepID=A0A9J7MT21_BRAFL|nr:glutathione S-transferase A-like [Branchiostoma floridae]
MASTEEMVLYYESGSTPCMSIMLALEEKGVSYTKKEVNTEKDEDIAMLEEVADRDEAPFHKTAMALRFYCDLNMICVTFDFTLGMSYKTICSESNPYLTCSTLQPPALLHGDNVLFDEVVPACLYLEKVFGNNRLIPEGAAQRAHVIKRMLQAQKIGVGDTCIDEYWEDDDEEEGDDDMDEEKADALDEKEDKEELAEELEHWEFYLKQGTYIAGSEFTMADCVFIPVLTYLVTNGLDLTKKYPLLHKYYTLVSDASFLVISKTFSHKFATSTKAKHPICFHNLPLRRKFHAESFFP